MDAHHTLSAGCALVKLKAVAAWMSQWNALLNQADDEMIWYHSGLIAGAIQALWGEHSTNCEPVDDITAIKVHDFRTMVEKAKKFALLQVILKMRCALLRLPYFCIKLKKPVMQKTM